MTEFKDTMQPIIELAYSQMRMEQEDEVMKAVQSIGVNVDKERLIQALTDARRFWQEGYDACLQWKPRWISVTERLPEHGQKVLGIDSDGEIEVWCFDAEYPSMCRYGGNLRAFDISRWMPLPEPPEVEV